jgi:hypothetical protein
LKIYILFDVTPTLQSRKNYRINTITYKSKADVLLMCGARSAFLQPKNEQNLQVSENGLSYI